MPQEMLLLSPEKTVVSFNIARLGTRVWAQIVDVSLILVLEMTLGLLDQFATPVLGGTAQAIMIACLTLGPFLYFILFEALWNGQTLGKKALGIRARMADGTPITVAAAFGRNLLRVADFLPIAYFLGTLAMFTNARAQRLGDMITNTVVTQEKKVEAWFTPAPYVLGVHPFEQHVGELRGMKTDEYYALKKLCDRFPELAANIQNNLIDEVWQPFAARYSIQPMESVHPIYLAEAVVMKYGRSHGLL